MGLPADREPDRAHAGPAPQRPDEASPLTPDLLQRPPTEPPGSAREPRQAQYLRPSGKRGARAAGNPTWRLRNRDEVPVPAPSQLRGEAARTARPQPRPAGLLLATLCPNCPLLDATVCSCL